MNERHAARLVLAFLALLTLVKLVLATRLQLFGDEAFYWLEGRHLALAYSDLPFVTAALTALGSALLPDTYLGVRLAFLVLGVATPLLVWRIAGEVDSPYPWWAAGASLCMPLLAIGGVLALPEVPLVFFTLVFMLGAVQMLNSDGQRGWWLAGLGAALGLSTHYRFVVVLAAAVLFLLLAARGRALLGRRQVWLGIGLAALGAVPILWFNFSHDFSGLRFQLLERHPWEFQLEGLAQPLVQGVVVTPLLFAALLGTLVYGIQRARAGSAVHGLLSTLALVPLVVFFLVGLWADQERTSFHWPLVGYLPLLVLLPEALSRMGGEGGLRIIKLGIPVLGILGSAVLFAYLFAAAAPGWLEQHARGKTFPANFSGWAQVGQKTGQMLGQTPGQVLIADNFMLGAELEFELPERSVNVVLDNPLNAKHGRAAQLFLWQMDETVLEETPVESGLLVAEISAVEFLERPAWMRRICDLFDEVRWLDELVLFQGRKRFLFFQVKSAGTGGQCQLPSFAWLDTPDPDQTVSGPVLIRGWAFNDAAGVNNVGLLLNGEVVSTMDYGRPYAGVVHAFPDSTDPNHPDVGFGGTLDTSGLEPGVYELAIRVVAGDGTQRDLESRQVVVAQ